MFHSARFLNGLLILLPTIALCDGANQTYEIDCNNLRMGQYICPHPDYDFIDHNTQQPRGCTKENKAKDVERWRKNVESAIKKQVYCSFHSLCKSWLRMLPLVALLFCIITFGDNYSTRAIESLRELYYFNKTKHRFFLLVLCLVADGLICTETKNNTFKKDIPCKWTNGYSFETSLLLSIFLGMFGADRFYLGYPALGLLKLSTLGFLFLGQFADVILIATQIVGPADGSHYVMPYYGAGINIVTSNNFTYRVPQYEY